MIVDSSTGIKMEEAVGKNEAGQVQVNAHRVSVSQGRQRLWE